MAEVNYQGKPCRYGHGGLRYKSNYGCINCTKINAKNKYKNNPELVKARSVAWKIKNPERHKTIARSVSELWRKKNIEKARASCRAWQKNHPGTNAAKSARRRAVEIMAMPAWADQKAIKDIYKKAAALGMHVDHTVPLRSPLVSGLHVEANLQLLPGLENVSKGNRYWPDMP